MCRNIRILFNFEPPVTEDEIRAASLQFVRKVSGFDKPSLANEDAFREAVEAITRASSRLLASLETNHVYLARIRQAGATRDCRCGFESQMRHGCVITQPSRRHIITDVPPPMKIALVNPLWPASGVSRRPRLPVELGYGSILLEGAGHETRLFDGALDRLSNGELADSASSTGSTWAPTASSRW